MEGKAMLSATLTHNILNCINCLELLAQERPGTKDAEHIVLCAKGLRAYIQTGKPGKRHIITTQHIYKHFRRNLATLITRCKEGLYDVDEASEICFALLEEMAVLIREKQLCSGGDITADERSIMDYFEQDGMWTLGDHTLISEYYFARLPLAALHAGKADQGRIPSEGIADRAKNKSGQSRGRLEVSPGQAQLLAGHGHNQSY